MKLILSHPTGNEFVRAAATGFLKKDILLNFNTTFASFQGSFIDQLGSIGALSEIHRRRFDSTLKPLTNLWPWREVIRVVASRAGLKLLVKHEKGQFCVDAVYRHLDRKVAMLVNKLSENSASAVYAYEDGAIATFRAAKKQGLECVYDLPIGYWRSARELLKNERENKPEWASTILSFDDSEEKLKQKDEELRLADRIIVASQFTANTLNLYPGPLAPIDIIPYAFPEVRTSKQYRKFKIPLKLLFVGGLSQRKGIAYLFEAVETLEPFVELTIVGQKSVQNCSALNVALSKHKWIPSLPHEKVLKLMREHDVLVFPSLFEGFGLVITEAMSQGTPVITTDRTAGPEFIDHGKNGWIIEAGSSSAIKGVIEEILYNPYIIEDFGSAATETARKRTWECYGLELAETLLRHND